MIIVCMFVFVPRYHSLNNSLNHSSIGHCVNLSNAYIMYPENNPTKRIIAEALLIKNSQTFPENKPSFDLNVF